MLPDIPPVDGWTATFETVEISRAVEADHARRVAAARFVPQLWLRLSWNVSSFARIDLLDAIIDPWERGALGLSLEVRLIWPLPESRRANTGVPTDAAEAR